MKAHTGHPKAGVLRFAASLERGTFRCPDGSKESNGYHICAAERLQEQLRSIACGGTIFRGGYHTILHGGFVNTFQTNLSVHQLISEQAALRPDSLAVTCDGVSITFGELNPFWVHSPPLAA